MPDLTFVIPVSNYHQNVVSRAIASVKAQSLPCDLVIIEDTAGRGAGWARNQGYKQAHTEWVSFLDADDTVAPKFAEMCLLMAKPERYVYTDWLVSGARYNAPTPCNLWTTRRYKQKPDGIPEHELQFEDGEWSHKTYHLVTTVIPTEIVHRIGGFDELLPGAEDTDFGIRLRLAGICGVHIKEPLLAYSGDGLRSRQLRQDAAFAQMTASYLKERYGSYIYMACCGDTDSIPVNPGNSKQDGDILVMPAWTGNRPIYGAMTGRFYGARVGGSKPLWLDPSDYLAMQPMFRKAEARAAGSGQVVLQPRYQGNAVSPLAQPGDWRNAATAAFGGVPAQPASQPTSDFEYKSVENTRHFADVLKIVRKK